jgi:hypothetical protein
MNYRGKDTLAEALKNGLLEKREKKAEPIDTVVRNIAEEQARFEESVAKPTAKDINPVAEALKPKRQAWAQKLWEENKPAPKPVAVPKPEKKKLTLEMIKESVSGLKPEIDTSKKAIKAEVLAENISEISSSLTHQNRRNYKPAKTETLEEKVNRLEGLLKKKLDEPVSQDKANEIIAANKAKREARAQTLGESVETNLTEGKFRDKVNKYGDKMADKVTDVVDAGIKKASKTKVMQGIGKGLDKVADHMWERDRRRWYPREDDPKPWYKRMKKKIMGEDVEPINELSAQTLTKYGDKAWRSKANAHIDRGGADFLDDDKARKTATKTIGKRERGLALAKNVMKKKDC